MYSIKLELLKVPCAFIKWQNAPSRTSVLAMWLSQKLSARKISQKSFDQHVILTLLLPRSIVNSSLSQLQIFF